MAAWDGESLKLRLIPRIESALKMLSANPLHSTHFPFGEIGLKVKRALCKLTDSCKKRLGYSAREVKTDIIEPLLILLDEELGTSMQYTFSAEVTPHCETGTKGNRERYDIIGQSEEDCPVIIIEVDTHRSDQVSKKVVSRIQLIRTHLVRLQYEISYEMRRYQFYKNYYCAHIVL